MNKLKKGCALAILTGLFFPAFAAPKVQNVTLSTKDWWSLAAVYQPASGKDKTVILLHDLGKKKEDFTSFEKALTKDRGHDRISVLCFGDSNTYGYDPRSFFGGRFPEEERWVNILGEKLCCETVNAGENGKEIKLNPATIR